MLKWLVRVVALFALSAILVTGCSADAQPPAPPTIQLDATVATESPEAQVTLRGTVGTGGSLGIPIGRPVDPLADSETADAEEAASAWYLAMPASVASQAPDYAFDGDMAAGRDGRLVHLVVAETALQARVRGLLGKKVVVSGVPFAAETVHHRTPILLEVTDVREANAQ